MAADSIKVAPTRRAPIKKRNYIEQAITDITSGVPKVIEMGKAAGQELQNRFRKIKDFVKR